MEPDTAHTTLDPRRWIAFAVVLAAGFMDLLDVTIVNVAVPSIQNDLHAQYSQLEWIIAAYVLSLGRDLRSSACSQWFTSESRRTVKAKGWGWGVSEPNAWRSQSVWAGTS